MHTITLPAMCDRAMVATLAEEIGTALSVGPVTIDATAVSRAGMQLLQLLVAGFVTASGTGATLQVNPSPAISESARLAGLDGILFDGVQP